MNNPITGTIRIEFQIIEGNLKLMVHAPLENEEQKRLTIQVLASAIPIAMNYQPSIIKPVSGNGKSVVLPPVPRGN